MNTFRKAIRSILTRRISINARTSSYEAVCLQAHLFSAGF